MQKTSKITLVSTLIPIFNLLMFLSFAEPEFLKTRPNVYQDTSSGTKIVISRTVPGVFVAIVKDEEGRDLQLFEPNRPQRKNVESFFLGFDPSKSRFSYIGVEDRAYGIVGSFTLLSNGLKVTLDYENSYLSFVRNGEGRDAAPYIMGLVGRANGLDVVVNAKGEYLVALLEANTFSEKFKDVFSPYKVENYQLRLRDKEVTTSTIGVSLDQERNPCLTEQSNFVTKSALVKIKSLDADNRKKVIQELIARKDKRNPLTNLLPIKVTPTSIIGINTTGGAVITIDQIQTPNGRLCVTDEITSL